MTPAPVDVRTSLVFEAPAGALFFAALALAAVFLALQHRRLRGSSPGASFWALMVTRGLILAAALAFLLEPTVLRQKLAAVKPRQTVLLDASRSMSLPYAAGESRLAAAEGIIRRLAGEAPGADLEVFSFDGQLNPVALGELGGVRAEGRVSDVAGAMAATAEREGDRRVLVLTDGRHNAGFAEHPLSGRFVLVGIGNREPFRDMRLTELKAADMGFQRKPLEVTARIAGEGYPEKKVEAILKVDGRLAGLREVVVPAGGEAEVRFDWTPQAVGTYRLGVEVKPLPEENILDNNARETSVKVARDRIRVLFISGGPNWNYRFLREALKRDPTLDMISFIILRSPTDVVDVPQEEISLIPFPVKKLFTEELDNFDLIIFDNFNYRPYFPPEYFENLKGRVSRGGAFWMWGGPMTFVNGGYRGTQLEDILPFTLEGPEPGQGYVTETFRASFTAEAENGPFFSLEGLGPGGLIDLPPLSGFDIVGPAREGSVVLAQHPTYKVQGRPMPLIAMRRFGQGRVMAVATDYLWNWDFVAAGSGQGNRAYLEFVKNAVRWLTGDPFLSPVRLTVTPDAAGAGETVTVRVRVLDDHYHPVDNASLDLAVIDPAGGKIPLKASPTGESGIYEAHFRLPREGGYRFAVTAAGAAGKFGQAQAALTAAGWQEEMSAPSMDEKFLRELASSSGSEYLAYRENDDFYRRLDKALKPEGEGYRVLGEERISLAGLPWTFAALILLLSADWVIRRRYRLE